METPQLRSLSVSELDVRSIFTSGLLTVLFIYAVAICRAYWLAMSLSPLNAVQGPPTQHWFFGFLSSKEAQAFQMSPLLLEYCAKFDGVWASLFTNRRPSLVLGDLAGIHHVLNDSHTYARSQVQMRTTRLIFGDGLVAVDGDQHKRQRRAIGPGFSSTAIDSMLPVFAALTEKLAKRWYRALGSPSLEAKSAANETRRAIEVNAYGDFENLFMDMIGESGFQYRFGSLEGHRSELEAAFVEVAQAATTGSLYSLLRSQLPLVETFGHWFVREQMHLDQLKQNIRTISLRLVENAKAHFQYTGADEKVSGRRDILGLLVQSNLAADAKHRLEDDEIVSIIPTLLSGGYDNNASAMSYAVMAMAQTPSTQKRLREELLAPPSGCEDWKSSSKALEKLPYLDAMCRETLRLYSPAHSIPRTCTKDDVIPLSKPIRLRDGSLTSEIRIGRGDDVIIPQKWMNVDPALWGTDANMFRPERWLQDPNHRYYTGGLNPVISGHKHSGWSSLMTFSIGPRNCIGYRMAISEIKVSLALLVAKFEFLQHDGMKDVYGQVQIVDRPRVKGVKGYCMPCWVRAIEE
ncbi:Cytochrome P450 [Cordyceps fumosorosea ARSEF 2679]|uniref:Cytochrome P450 n=1 Tax=Cordyceps fumosorosea (strain ARSEF 2679) TaxID=1081104 RepID=A0A168EMV6_CORFA|nr:Cytochrome P450 [Cordyceps fumosorosea ARSEF 2679]OAA74001.1 Cytochrome P450 [Cordyceps fumosorosea ARSEF 2679]